MNANAPTSAGMAPPRDDQGHGNTSTAPHAKKIALALDLRRIHAQSIRCAGLSMSLVLGPQAQAALMRAAEMLEEPDS